MAVRRFFDKEITVRRLKTVSGSKKAFQSTATTECHIQDIDRQSKMQMGIVQDRAWIGYFSADEDEYTPTIGDQLTDENNMVYKIIDVTKKDYSFGINQHIEAILVEYSE